MGFMWWANTKLWIIVKLKESDIAFYIFGHFVFRLELGIDSISILKS